MNILICRDACVRRARSATSTSSWTRGALRWVHPANDVASRLGKMMIPWAVSATKAPTIRSRAGETQTGSALPLSVKSASPFCAGKSPSAMVTCVISACGSPRLPHRTIAVSTTCTCGSLPRPASLPVTDATIHRLLGHPDPVQGDMKFECQLVTNGLYCGDSSGYQDARAKELRGGAAEWRLLLQVDSQDEAGMMWGDVGRIYYWIKHSDLLRRDWDLSWLVLQCG
jgi:hypothetical protein